MTRERCLAVDLWAMVARLAPCRHGAAVFSRTQHHRHSEQEVVRIVIARED